MSRPALLLKRMYLYVRLADNNFGHAVESWIVLKACFFASHGYRSNGFFATFDG